MSLKVLSKVLKLIIVSVCVISAFTLVSAPTPTWAECSRGSTVVLAISIRHTSISIEKSDNHLQNRLKILRRTLHEYDRQTQKSLLDIGQKSRNYFNYSIRTRNKRNQKDIRYFEMTGTYIVIMPQEQDVADAIYNALDEQGFEVKFFQRPAKC